ncbi:DUF1566 domain-containing protein [Marinobacterium sp. D7]|uniref:Lcl C-terminal domain-containing protein n=1 Tax=Marinobacterium ramblicola TaxID=2849041 RepID=UPI001C2DC322|nr:DUF1566 domain-containing protein [Marinobacterium ramblicola]MBV1787358.1 DUF1566 domain-containing protein [Marinobacterium ramblicola]
MKKGLFALLLATAFANAQPPAGGPPPQAIEACRGQSRGDQCSFRAPHGQISGSCHQVPEGLICVPDFAGHAPAGDNQAGRMSPNFGPAQAKQPSARFGNDRAGASGHQGAPMGADIASTDDKARQVTSRIPDTQQGSCFDTRGMIDCPQPGQAFFGQDAQYAGAGPSYAVQDGIVSDRITGLIWQQAHNADRLSWPAAQQACAQLALGGFTDWRLPSIKELFSIADFRGSVGRRPYLDEVFEIREPDASILQDDPFASTHTTDMMGQTWSATLYSGDHWDRKGVEAAFFMNFLDGHIKQAPTDGGRSELFYRCVRGESWGANDFVDNGNGTVTDRASALTWQQSDDGRARNWQQALTYCEELDLAGHSDWRLPNIKELQSIVDYTHHDPALDLSVFRQQDHRGWFWSSTTHGDNIQQADYICFGKCTSTEGIDVHGAGAQRSDPKDSSVQRRSSQGGQRDEIRVDNYVRCVR